MKDSQICLAFRSYLVDRSTPRGSNLSLNLLSRKKMDSDLYKAKSKEFSSGFSIENLLKKQPSEKRSIDVDTDHYRRKSIDKKLYEELVHHPSKERIRSTFSYSPTAFQTYSSGLYDSPDIIPSPSWESTTGYGRNISPQVFADDRRRLSYSSIGPLHSPLRRSAFRVPFWNDYSSVKKGVTCLYPGSYLKPEFVYTDNMDDPKKCGQVRFSHSQSTELERVFCIQKYISPHERKQIARSLDLSERQVKTWFQNRRAKWRRLKIEDEMRAKMSKKHASVY